MQKLTMQPTNQKNRVEKTSTKMHHWFAGLSIIYWKKIGFKHSIQSMYHKIYFDKNW